MAKRLDSADLRNAIKMLEDFASRTADPQVREQLLDTARGLRLQYCTSCGRLSEDCSANPCDDVEADRDN